MHLMEIFDRNIWSNSTPSQGGGKQIKYLAYGGEVKQRRMARRKIFGVKYLWDPTMRGALILTHHFDFGAVFGENEVLETHLALLRNQNSELEKRFLSF